MSVTWSEPDNEPGGADGTTNDIVHDEDTFRLCAERNGKGGEEGVYTITYQATDIGKSRRLSQQSNGRPAGAGLL